MRRALVELVKTLGYAVRMVRPGAVLVLLGVWLTNLVGVVGAFTIAAFEATVIGIAEGDTLTVLREDKTPVRVRLHGIDAPENGQPFWAQAKAFASGLAYGQVVRVEPTDFNRDGHVVAHVILPDGRNLNRELVRAGLAWWYRHYAPHDVELAALEAEARAARRGLWAEPRPIPPWEWRRGSVTSSGARPAARGWVLPSPVDAASANDESATPPLDEGPVVQPYPNGDTCERAREEQLSAALRVAKVMGADPEAEVTTEAWRRTLAVGAARCVPAP